MSKFNHPTTLMAFDAANDSLPSGSYFRKAVTLQNWWLTKPETDEDTKRLGVAGTSQQNQATRCFSSAPILKAYDIVDLETVDGVSIILQGFINKDRTLENGFSPEVFDHFVFGFPPYWEEFATSFPKGGSAAKCVSRVHEDEKDSIEGHTDIYKVSSLEFPHEHITKDGHGVLICERSPVTAEFKDDPNLGMSPVVRNGMDSCTGLKHVGVSSRRMTRSMTKMDSRKSNNSVLLHGISNVDKVTVINPVNIGSCDILRIDINQGENKDADVSGELEIDTTRSNLEAKHIKSECSDPLSSTNVDVIDVNDEILLPRTNMKACQNKKKIKEGKSGSRIDVPNKEGVAATHGTRSNLAIRTRSKSKRKQTTETPKSAKSTSRVKKGSKEIVKILSPESFSGKKSRSGRALLPVLEFWRNERVVYDADGYLCGVQTYVRQSSRGTRGRRN